MTARVRLLVFSTALAATFCLLGVGWSLPVSDLPRFWNEVAAFAVLEFLSAASYLKLRVGRSEASSSVAFIPYLASLLLFDTGWAVAMAASAEFVAEYGVRRKPGIKILFNVAQHVVSLTLASWVYHSLGGISSLTRFVFAPAATASAVVTYFALNSTSVTAVVALSDQVPFDSAWRRIAGPSLLYDVFSSALGPLLAYMYVEFQLPGIVLLVLPIFFVRHIYQANIQLQQVNRDLLELMVKTIEARDPYTSGHSLRVAQVASQLAREKGLSGKAVEQITTAALLHDVGKIHEDFAPLLRKESKLDATEKALMQTHPSRSAELVCTISAFHGAIEQAVRHHHENYDGTGYPLGLAGDAIPIGARIIMIADTMDAMTTDRPYRKALTFERVIEELRRYAGRQFDSSLVELIVRSSAIKSMVAARLAREPLEVPAGGLAVFARGDRPIRSSRVAAGG
jgi:putative nucleotidyltransferase with HDIG domain